MRCQHEKLSFTSRKQHFGPCPLVAADLTGRRNTRVTLTKRSPKADTGFDEAKYVLAAPVIGNYGDPPVDGKPARDGGVCRRVPDMRPQLGRYSQCLPFRKQPISDRVLDPYEHLLCFDDSRLCVSCSPLSS